ncbi:MAG: hypothetical protein VB111_05970 [Clostridiaceae bacterium]|nr:hypothetical protein [Clostridiaceae bacterium]
MDVSLNGAEAIFRTSFSQNYDLLQIFHGLKNGYLGANNPVDFRAAGLQKKGCRDIWHMDVVLAFSTDEVSPQVIGGVDIGGNHSQDCAVRVWVPGHAMDTGDIGSLWRDESGIYWTCLRIENRESMLFVSENIGASKEDYAFAQKIEGSLTYISDGNHVMEIMPVKQTGCVSMHRSIRHTKRELSCWKDGQRQNIIGYHTDVSFAKITEEYEIINPATVGETLRKNRPLGGYRTEQDLAIGEAMFHFCAVYSIADDGTVLVDFDHQRMQNVRWESYLGVMYQEKCDVYGGGIWRYIPKTRPFIDHGTTYDFSHPHNTSEEPFPKKFRITPEYWADPDNPPDRQIDFIRKPESEEAFAFVGGYLPLYDGAPVRRKANITDAVCLVDSRKTYPAFIGGSVIDAATRSGPTFTKAHGVAYRKYYPSGTRFSAYTVDYDGITYLYVDLFEQCSAEIPILNGCRAEIREISATLTWEQHGETLTITGQKGYAVFTIKS